LAQVEFVLQVGDIPVVLRGSHVVLDVLPSMALHGG